MKLADTQDLSPCGAQAPCGFEPRLGYLTKAKYFLDGASTMEYNPEQFVEFLLICAIILVGSFLAYLLEVGPYIVKHQM